MARKPEILFEDEDLVAVNKPAGVLSIPDRFDPTIGHLSGQLRERFGNIFVVHRIDKQTSGVMVFAKNSATHAALNRQFERHEVRKTYWLLIHGLLNVPEGAIDLPIAENPSRPGTVYINVAGKPSVTHYRVLETFRSYSLVEAAPLSGRLHQIRIHFHAIGHPLAVDEIYGSDRGIFLSSLKKNYKLKPGLSEKPLIERLTLHARSLTFTHPAQQSQLTIEAPLPKDFSSVLNQLRKHG